MQVENELGPLRLSTRPDDDMPWRIDTLAGGGDDDFDELERLLDGSPVWRRFGLKGLVAVLAVLLLGAAVGLQATDAGRNRLPWCQDPDSDYIGDPTGDGYGWENSSSCRVRPDQLAQRSSQAAAPLLNPPSSPATGSSVVPGPPTTSDAATSSPTQPSGPDTAGSAADTSEGSDAPDTEGATGDGATPEPSDGAPAARGEVPAVPSLGGNYQSNLELIRTQAVRNRNEDDSPHLRTPSAQLVPENHYGPRSDYLGNPAGNPEQAFPVSSGGQFRVGCEFSHFAYDDPLVYPNQPGAAHLHMFFGNTDVNAYSTADSILNSGGSTCNGQELNRTGYWVPALLDGQGSARIPERIVVYYKGEGLANGKAEPFPEGAAMVTKVDLNTVNPGAGGAQGKFSFVCSDNYSGASAPASNTMPSCDGSRFKNQYGSADPHVVLEMNVKFPQCWNGKDPSNPANYSHPTEGGWYYSSCTGEFNRTLVNLEYFVNYKVEIGENTSDWYLSSDVDPVSRNRRPGPAGATIHADWWSGWHKQTNQMFLDNCVNFRTSAPSGCGFGYLTNGGPNGNSPLPGPALKYREQYTGPGKVPAAELHRELCPRGGNLAGAAASYCSPGQAVVRASLAQSSLFCNRHLGMTLGAKREEDTA